MHYEPPNTSNRRVNTDEFNTRFFGRWNLAHLLGLILLFPLGTLMLALWSPAATTAIWLVSCLCGFAIAEKLRPYRINWRPTRKDMSTDGLLLLAAALVDGLLKHSGLLLAQWAASQGHSPGWASAWPLVLAIPAAIVLGELGPYILHRWAHTHSIGWRWHQLHHVPVQVNVSNSVRVHPVNLAWNVSSRGLVWWGLGFTPETLTWATMFMLLQGVAVHANVRGHIGPLAWVIGSAEAHRWHHSKQVEEALNFGTSVPLWDQLLGTWRRPSRSGPKAVGLHD
jgi:sterol desaturase/sphingolipid hydroxylase (fatty acid hydroxylase superfamily)